MNTYTKIQLLDTNNSILDVREEVQVPINFNVADIRDLSKRSGIFSKTIRLPGTKRNNQILNHYFDINIADGSFDVNKKQRCKIIQNNTVILNNAYIQLVSVNKVQNRQTEDDEVEYEVLIKDTVSDFFTQINNLELTQLGFDDLNHIYNTQEIIDSFVHTVDDGYKYILPWIDNNIYSIKECFPGIYAKQYWDRIHEQNGFTYTWSELDSPDVRFDQLIIPYNGDSKKLTEEFQDSVRVEAESTGPFETALGNNNGTGTVSNIFWRIFDTPNEITDPLDLFNPSTFVYDNPFNLSPGDNVTYEVRIDFDFIMVNQESVNVNLTGGQINTFRPELRIFNQSNALKGQTSLQFTSINQTIATTNSINLDQNNTRIRFFPISMSGGYNWPPGETVAASGQLTTQCVATNVLSTDFLRIGINAIATQGAGAFWRLQSSFTPANMFAKIRVNSVNIKIQPNTDSGIPVNGPVILNQFVPKQFKQSEFIKSICLMYNLYVDTDPNDQTRLIYKRRNKYYDDGRIVNWTEKLARNEQQQIRFIPELLSKSIVLTYKQDSKDGLAQSYLDATNKIYGQIEYIFKNDWVRGQDKKELMFSPTLNIWTNFSSNNPVWETLSPKTNPRILLDNGILNCGQYSIQESPGIQTQLSYYPFVSHFDRPTDPTFDINFGICDFYPYNVGTVTQNNLFFNNWLRTMLAVDDGRMLTAYFNLNELDIQQLRLSDKIRIDNAYFYINKIIDYDANNRGLTKVELLTVEQDLKLGSFRNSTVRPVIPVGPLLPADPWSPTPGPVKPIGVGEVINPGPVVGPIGPVGPVRPIKDFANVTKDLTLRRYDGLSLIDTDQPYINMGTGNWIQSGFTGIVIGSNLTADKDGILVGNWLLSEDGLEYRGQIVIDGGFNEVLNLNKENLIDVLDGGLNSVRPLGGDSKLRPVIDGAGQERII
jgi:hypothetical protein